MLVSKEGVLPLGDVVLRARLWSGGTQNTSGQPSSLSEGGDSFNSKVEGGSFNGKVASSSAGAADPWGEGLVGPGERRVITRRRALGPTPIRSPRHHDQGRAQSLALGRISRASCRFG